MPHHAWPGDTTIAAPVNTGDLTSSFCGQPPVTSRHVPSWPKARTSTPARSTSVFLYVFTRSHSDQRMTLRTVATIATDRAG